MDNLELKIRNVLQLNECTFDESIKRVAEMARNGFCRAICDEYKGGKCSNECELFNNFVRNMEEVKWVD